MAMATSRSVLINLKFACIAALAMILAMNRAPLVVDAGYITFTDNCLFYCQDCLVHGSQASLFSWLGCCPGLVRDSKKLNTPGVNPKDVMFACLGYKCYCQGLNGYSNDYMKYTLDRCNTTFNRFTMSSNTDCFKEVKL
ncbi:hypothetical protein Droror1_Dr00013768 [Drosera rotundifolia]